MTLVSLNFGTPPFIRKYTFDSERKSAMTQRCGLFSGESRATLSTEDTATSNFLTVSSGICASLKYCRIC